MEDGLGTGNCFSTAKYANYANKEQWDRGWTLMHIDNSDTTS
jgi:hypothetical protein